MGRPTQVKIDTYIKENSGTITINKVGRPPVEQSKDSEIKARVDDETLKAVMGFCRGRRISRSEYIRHLMSLDTEYFDLLHVLNDPEVKKFVFHALSISKKI